MTGSRLNRRAFLKGSGGIAIALPFLEVMGLERAHAAGEIPKRFVSTFHGQALGPDGGFTNFFVPTGTGTGYPLSVSLNPLGTHNIKNDVSVITGLNIPLSGPGSRDAAFHLTNPFCPQFCGAKTIPYVGAYGEGADQIAARVVGSGVKFGSVAYCGQALQYEGNTFDQQKGATTYRRADNGRFVPIFPEMSPERAFSAMFSGLLPGGGSAVDPKVVAELNKRKSILDFVLAQRNALTRTLGVSDAARLNEHFDQIRDLEKSLITPTANGATCVSPMAPGPDPALNMAAEKSGESRRNRVFMDIIHMALVCDLTRSVHHMFTMAQSFMSATEVHPALSAMTSDLHDLGHGGGGTLPTPPPGTPFHSTFGGTIGSPFQGFAYAMALGHAWAIDHFAYLIAKLKSTPEGSGTVLDNTVLVMGFEGGHGGGTDVAGQEIGTHSTENMAMLIAGGASGGLRHGRHLATNRVHPARVTISALQAIGGPTTLGEISGSLPELFQT